MYIIPVSQSPGLATTQETAVRHISLGEILYRLKCKTGIGLDIRSDIWMALIEGMTECLS
jgi:hypothetical protein